MGDPNAEPQIRDMFEFCERWPALRPRMEALARDPRLDAEQRAILDWAMRVVDLVGPGDLGAAGE